MQCLRYCRQGKMANTDAGQADCKMTGRVPDTTIDDVREAFSDREDLAEPLTAPELAELLDCSRRTALNKLHDLEAEGEVISKEVGGRAKVWWVPIPSKDNTDD